MTVKRTIACVIGTRPEAIKMAPIVRALRDSSWARCVVVATAQHRDLLDQMLDRLNVEVDHDLGVMREGQTLSDLTARMVPRIDTVLNAEKPAAVLAQGDTTSVFISALSAFHRRIPFGHVEAGLRTGKLDQPFPEEGYRQMVSRLARWNFVPTHGAAEALRREGIDNSKIHLTGNTCIDTLFQTIADLEPEPETPGRMILLTAHRRESFGQPLQSVFKAVRVIADRFADVSIIYPVHPNPEVRETALRLLSDHPRIHLTDPVNYHEFVRLMQRCELILTDSGGIQEEAPALGKPVLVLRDVTERPEAIEAGAARLVGTDPIKIINAATNLLTSDEAYSRMASTISPFGDGNASKRIVDVLTADLVGEKCGLG